MLIYPEIDPVAISFWRIQIHWYGILYLVAFAGCYWLLQYRAKTQPLTSPLHPQQIGDLIFYLALGVVLGGRIGYILFYNASAFLDNPLVLFKVWQGGMSFHGGFAGVLVAAAIYCRTQKVNWLSLTDFFAPAVPFGLLCGRIGNFINGELWGRPSDLPWAMVFPVDDQPRHPSMLYEALLEGVLLFVILWWFSAKRRPRMAVSALFLIGYGLFRFMVEFVREPDEHIGFLSGGWMTMGHVLTLPMIVLGIVMLIMAYLTGRTGSKRAV
jgi:phosphatidylglycerol:prolipoprotein diacylglycerol transferase